MGSRPKNPEEALRQHFELLERRGPVWRRVAEHGLVLEVSGLAPQPLPWRRLSIDDVPLLVAGREEGLDIVTFIDAELVAFRSGEDTLVRSDEGTIEVWATSGRAARGVLLAYSLDDLDELDAHAIHKAAALLDLRLTGAELEALRAFQLDGFGGLVRLEATDPPPSLDGEP